MNRNFSESIFNLLNKFSLQQKLLLGGTVGVMLVLFSILLFFLNEPSFSPLYANLSEDDAAKVIDYLSQQKIQYQIDDNGKTIKVPKETVYETRLMLAGKGIPASGIIGYEIFDKNTMGMSEFMQKLNYKRALEGELARTIMQQDGVDGVRVHIVIPARSIFKDEEKFPTASVVLKLKNNFSMSKNSMTAIANLISSSVEGLTPSNVTLIDTKGRILSKEFDDNPIAFSSSKQYEMKQSVENYLSQKAQVILDNILGYGNSMIQVNADMNFDQIEKTMTLFDPASQVAISEQTIKTENNGSSLGDSSAQISQNNTTNYEINKTVQRIVEGTGNIKRLSVAAVINDVLKDVSEGEQTKTVNEPRPPEQMKKLEEIIKNAVGMNQQRDDQFSIVNISFETKPLEEIQFEEPSFINDMDDWTDILLILVSIVGAIFVLKTLMSKLKTQNFSIDAFNQSNEPLGLVKESYSQPVLKSAPVQNRVPGASKKNMLPLGDIEDEISDEAVIKKNKQEKISNYVAKNPVETAKLINSWLHEDEM